MTPRPLLIVIGIVAAFMASPAAAQQPLPQIASPLHEAGIPAPADFVLPLALDPALYEALKDVSAMRLTGFPIGPGQRIDLDLQQFDVLSRGARLIIADGEQEVETARPDLILLRGTVAGLHESAAFLALSPHGSNGYIRLPRQSWIIATPPAAQAGDGGPQPTVIYELSALPEGAMTWTQFQCGTDQLEDEHPRVERLLRDAVLRNARYESPIDNPPCRQVRIAIDSDWQYTGNVFGGNTTASQAYIITLMAAVNEIYVREVNTSFDVVYIRVWSSNNTPYSATSVNERLNEFRSHWNSNMGSISRHVAHMITGLRSGAGGVAWLGQLCGGSYSYGASGYINGGFPYPIQNNHPQNWDLMVVSHEIGHNFNAPHTHSMSPPIDNCGNGNCSGANLGTIMSYCHTCSGGMSNMRMDLHERIINERILPYLAGTSCAASFLCPSDPGACCLAWGGCEFMDEQACNLIAGSTFSGSNITCAAASCAEAGACCLPDGSCVMVTQVQCSTHFSGTFDGSINCGEGRCATTPVLWNHGPLATNPGIGCSGRDVSLVQNGVGNINRGWDWNLSANRRIADEFIVPEGDEWQIDGITLFAYHIDATSPNYTNIRIQIWDGDPRLPGSSVVAGDMATNRLNTASMTNMHRIRPGVDAITSCSRRIQQLDCSFQATLGPGRYWIDRTGAVTSGTPWIAPVTYTGVAGKPHGESLVFASGQWSVITDTGSSARQAMPFILLGTNAGDCYANCDGSTAEPILTVDDFTCFINEFAAAQTLPHEQQIGHYANCDGSTAAPVLTVDDFTCFINAFAQGCP